MAYLRDIVTQLNAVLPKYTDKFNSSVAISAITRNDSSSFRITTSLAHGLSTGDYVGIKNALVVNPIINASLIDNILTLTTQFQHDMTENFEPDGTNYPEYVNLSGFTGLDDGDYLLLTAPTANTFTIEADSLPSVLGNVNESRIDGINGRFEITVVDTTNFDITVDTEFDNFDAQSITMIEKNLRVAPLATVDRMIERYKKTTQTITDYWMFVVNNDAASSWDRKINSDAVNKKQKLDDLYQELHQTFSIFVVIPTSNTFRGYEASDSAIDIRKALCKTLCGVEFSSGFSQEEIFLTTYTRDNFFAYVGAYYIHEYVFENVYMFNPSDSVEPDDSRAFRRFEANFKLVFDNYEETKKEVDGNLP